MRKHENDEYDLKYSQDDYFHNRKLINEIYVKSLVRKVGITKTASLLDVGCGQGHFSYLFKKYGMQVLGIDLSKSGISYAKERYQKNGLNFMVCDAFEIPVSTKFDYILCRGLSLYNTNNVQQIHNITEKLMNHLKKDGVFIFLYHSNFNKKKQSDSWRCHSLDEISQYFSDYNNKTIYFTSKVDCFLFGKFAFNNFFSNINSLASKILGLGGEIVCFIKK